MFTIEISVENVAFDYYDRYIEVARILRAYAERLENRDLSVLPDRPLYDSNGNRVGVARWTTDKN